MSQRRHILLLGAISLASLSAYLLFSHFTYRTGFPLDDAWIHQTYARNLAESGEWAFIPGQPSAGSTAPLWSVILALGHLLGLGPYVWTYFVGFLTLWGLSIAGYVGFTALLPHKQNWALLAGGLFALEWHLVWAAASGMETALFALVALVVLGLQLPGCLSDVRRRQQPGSSKQPGSYQYLAIGSLVGLSVWLRPDGVTLLGPLALVLLLSAGSFKHKLRIATWALAGFLLLAGPYLAFNRALAGAWWPNTFYAKQAEYAVLRQLPLWRRYLGELALPLVGAGAVLAPGFLYALYAAIRRRAWAVLAAGIWILGYLGLYAWRLPVTYQHGRYVIPAMPVFFLLGLLGMAELVELSSAVAWRRIASRAWVVTVATVLVLFWLIGAPAYAADVAIIESEMVRAAQWVAVNTEAEALVAAHDIGALGYFANRELLDLAGLVSPEVIPFIRDEAALAGYLDEQGADYLVTFPDWYPQLVQHGEEVYRTEGQFSPEQGGENMAVFRWRSP